jgi:MFS family permease
VPHTDLTPATLTDPVTTSRSHRRQAWTVTGLLVVFMMVNFADKSVLLMNAVVTTGGLIAPALTGYLVDTQGRTGYQHAVLLAAALLALGGTAAVTLIHPARDARRLAP